ICTQSGIDPADINQVMHGTTVATNAVLTGKGATVGLITTAGYKQVLQVARSFCPGGLGGWVSYVKAPLLAALEHTIEAEERLDAAGAVVTPLNDVKLRADLRRLADRYQIEALTICFINAYVNGEHEQQARAIAQEVFPDLPVSISSEVVPEMQEYERTETTVVNSYVRPEVSRYVNNLQASLEQTMGGRVKLAILRSDGGLASARAAGESPVNLLLSGPAGGVAGARYFCRRGGFENILTFDMGGTSTDVALIRKGTPPVSNEIEVEYAMPIHVPMVDVRTVGAGGGSIARVNAAGLLEVGPESAGADPGPICYGRGGTAPTISDANMLLGRLNTDKLNSVTGGVSLEDLAAVFARDLGAPLGVGAVEAAEAVIRVANAKMAGAIRMVSLSLGADPRDFALFAFGGAGPLHAAALARELGVPRVLIPARPGITNALGCAVADLRHDFVQTLNLPLDDLDMGTLHGVFTDKVAAGEAALERENVAVRKVQRDFSVDMQYLGQSHVVRVPLPDGVPTAEALRERFEKVYWDRFRVALQEIRARVVNVNTSVIGLCDPVDLTRLIDPAGRQAEATPTGHRPVSFHGQTYETPVYWRDHLPEDVALDGPVIIEQLDCTTLIPPGDRVTGGVDGNLTIQIGTET
ncbi:MAG: hydantoinase/oxoprolinase family protein, partial [Sulfitobacter sp.]|nr:hydantoinase/oxoprolinase family protein [Sulfitobacter sp.]